jgi:hypothetical protein
LLCSFKRSKLSQNGGFFLRSFTSIGVKTVRGTTRDFNVRPRLENGRLILPSSRIVLSEMKQVVLNKRSDTIFINMVDSPPIDPQEEIIAVEKFIAGFEEKDYL